MRILGLTGGIGSGKTTASVLLETLHFPVHCSDEAVHRILKEDKDVITTVQRIWPGAVVSGVVDRKALGRIVFSHEGDLRRLEAIVFPKVWASQRRFLQHHARLRSPWVVLDIPLLFETGGEERVDFLVSIVASQKIREDRVLRRSGVTREVLENILLRQVNDKMRKKKSDFILHSGLSRSNLRAQLQKLVEILPTVERSVWSPRWGKSQGRPHARDRFRHRNHRT